MPIHHHHKKKNLLNKAFQYGFHLWTLLFVSNLLIFYSFTFFTQAAEQEAPAADSTPTLTEAISIMPGPPTRTQVARQPTKVVPPKPKGPVINLAFSLPGIGSGGGTMEPERKTRNLTVFLYAPDVNSYDSSIRPLHTVRTRAEYDTNPLSPTYTAFINNNIDMGDTVKNGKYQVAFMTDQSIIELVKEKPDSIGGKIVDISIFGINNLPLQTVIMGDVSPATGDNIMDIEDWNTFVNCYGAEEPCSEFKRVDLNDDGVLDGIDYNILARGYNAYHKLGFPVPVLSGPQPTQVSRLSQLNITPQTSPTAAAPSPSAAPVTKTGGNPLGAIFGFFFFLILVAAGLFVFSRTKFGKAFLATHPIPFLKPKEPKPDGGAAAAPAEGQKAQTAEGQEAVPAEGETPAEAEQPSTAAAVTPAEASTEVVAESTEIPIETLQAEKAAADSTPPPAAPTAAAPEAAPAAPAAGSVDKTYYVKNKSKDPKGTWVVLTDDAGPIDGLYNGDITDGFARIKGTMTEENGKKYITITEVLPSE